jgi:voltage-gated potassium channel
VLEGFGWLIWGAFVMEYLVLLYLAPDKGRMARTHLLDLAIILLPFLRPLRAARVLRLLRAGAGAGRATVAVRRILARPGFAPFMGVVLLVVLSCAALAYAFERGHPDATSPRRRTPSGGRS